ncbi:MAG: HD domain-containing protein, partial [Acidimicrobiales bacterium]
ARARRQWREGARRGVPALERLVAERHEREGEVAFLLEPDLKEGNGGLRDVTAMRALAAAAPILPEEDPCVDGAARALAMVRAELHRQAGRRLDRLLLQEQDGVAAALGLPDADTLMSEVAAAARALSSASDDAWRRARSWLAGPRGRALAPDRPLGPGLVLREGEVEVDLAAPAVAADPTLALRAAEAAARNGTRLSRAALATIAGRATLPDPRRPWPDGARRALVSLLGAGRAAIPVLEDLDRAGLVVRLLPEWATVRNRPQRNAYHRYTVDRHLLEAAAEAAALVRLVARPDLLLVGAWLHDLGKGSPGDHTRAGTVLVAEIGPRLGFPPDDVEVLVTLVAHHLLLAEAATRRDLADPSTVRAVAAAVRDHETLDLLAALTEADGRATGEWAWSAWKQGLVAGLVAEVGRALAGHHPPPLPAFPLARHRPLLEGAGGGWLAVGEGDRLTVVGPDRPGVLSLVAGVLALEGLAVLTADAWSGGGVAVSEHVVTPEAGGEPDWDAVRARLADLARHPEALEPAMARRARAYARRPRPRAGPGPRVRIDLEASSSATVVEVWAADEAGLLHRLAGTVAGLGLDIRHARAETLGHEVVDTFYLTDAGGGKVTAPAPLARLEAALLLAAGRERNAGPRP